jgi:hypothetical protein
MSDWKSELGQVFSDKDQTEKKRREDAEAARLPARSWIRDVAGPAVTEFAAVIKQHRGDHVSTDVRGDGWATLDFQYPGENMFCITFGTNDQGLNVTQRIPGQRGLAEMPLSTVRFLEMDKDAVLRWLTDTYKKAQQERKWD